MTAIAILTTGQRVGRCTFDSVSGFVDLDVYDEQRKDLIDHLRLSQPFLMTVPGSTLSLDPASSADMSHVVDLAWKVVATGFAYPDGRLDVTFSDGTRIEAGPSGAFEAWEYWGTTGGGQVVSVPGGQLAVFPSSGPADAGQAEVQPRPE